MRFVVIALLIAIVANLASALFHVFSDPELPSRRALKALTWRVALSLLLFLALMLGQYFGWITGHALLRSA